MLCHGHVGVVGKCHAKVHCKQYELCPMMQLPETGVIAITGGNGALGLVTGLAAAD